MSNAIPTDHDLDAAYRALVGVVRRTPVLESPTINEATGGRFAASR